MSSCSVTEKIRNVNVPSPGRVCDDQIMHLNHLRSLIVLSTKENNLPFTRTSMPRLRQNDRERAVGMVQTGMTHQAVADHFNVPRITISRLINRLRQTGRTNDRSRNNRPHVTSQRQDRHLHIFTSGTV
jgi:hypothetical protein